MLVTAGATLMVSAGTVAAPDWSRGESLGDIRVYPDHQLRGTWYFEPGEIRLDIVDGHPDLHFKIFRYIGQRETGDTDAFSIRGVLTFGLKQEITHEAIAVARRVLEGRQGFKALQPLPLKQLDSTLVYAIVEDDVSGEIAGGESATKADGEFTATWRRRTFTVALQPITAELFWSGFQDDRLQLSANYVWKSEGRVPKRNGPGWDVQFKEIANAVPIRASAEQYPDLFEQVDTWSRIPHDRTTVTVSCYDFIDEEPTELYRVVVELRFRTLRDQDYVEKLAFEQGDIEFEKSVSFKLAKDLSQPYQYRVTRIFDSDRPRDVTNWLEHRGQYLDVTMTN
jgi:hypothetical protein